VIDVASWKKGVKKSTFNEACTKNPKNRLLGAVKVLADRCKCFQIHLGMSDMIPWGPLSPQRVMEILLQKNLPCWGSTFAVISIVYSYICYVKTKVKLIYALSAQSISRSKSIAIWPTTAQLCHPASLRHRRQSGFHETHPKLSIDCKVDQETRHNSDRTCQIWHSCIQLFLWNWSSELIKVHTTTHWVLGLSIHVARIRSSIIGWESADVPSTIRWEEDIAINHPSHLLEAQNQV
jgi:hypothetical protein